MNEKEQQKLKFMQGGQHSRNEILKCNEHKIKLLEDSWENQVDVLRKLVSKTDESTLDLEHQKTNVLRLLEISMKNCERECASTTKMLTSLVEKEKLTTTQLDQYKEEYGDILKDQNYINDSKNSLDLLRQNKKLDFYHKYCNWMNENLGINVVVMNEKTVEVVFSFENPQRKVSALIAITDDNELTLLKTVPELQGCHADNEKLSQSKGIRHFILSLRQVLQCVDASV